jgi:hypothetical protein
MERKCPVLETENPVSLPAIENAASPLVILVGEEDETVFVENIEPTVKAVRATFQSLPFPA